MARTVNLSASLVEVSSAVDLGRMLDKCRRDQWRIEDLDWTLEPRPMSREREELVVQYFTDMAAIERLAKALFEQQRSRVSDPTLRKIFSTFIVDEERHAQVAERLAAHYNVHRYRRFESSETLTKFRPHFLAAVEAVSAEIANVYITGGELLLDIALLRSIDDYVDDEMSKRAMRLINRDESRHIAIDYYMVEYYASPAYQSWLATQPSPTLREHAKATWVIGNLLFHARPFFNDVFMTPIGVCDPSGQRIREAMKRLQLISQRPEVAKRPFSAFINRLRTLYHSPLVGPLFGGLLARVAGVPGEFMSDLFTEADVARVRSQSYEEMAQDALDAKTQ